MAVSICKAVPDKAPHCWLLNPASKVVPRAAACEVPNRPSWVPVSPVNCARLRLRICDVVKLSNCVPDKTRNCPVDRAIIWVAFRHTRSSVPNPATCDVVTAANWAVPKALTVVVVSPEIWAAVSHPMGRPPSPATCVVVNPAKDVADIPAHCCELNPANWDAVNPTNCVVPRLFSPVSARFCNCPVCKAAMWVELSICKAVVVNAIHCPMDRPATLVVLNACTCWGNSDRIAVVEILTN